MLKAHHAVGFEADVRHSAALKPYAAVLRSIADRRHRGIMIHTTLRPELRGVAAE